MKQRYLLIPLPKSPYYRVGPLRWQDWYRQIGHTIAIARSLKNSGSEVVIAIMTALKPPGKISELEIYSEGFKKLAPELDVRLYQETNDTLGQVEKSFELAKKMNAELVFVSAWMQYPRAKYLARGKRIKHFGVFGIPSPLFLLIDPLALILQPVMIAFGLGKFFQDVTVRRREKGTIW